MKKVVKWGIALALVAIALLIVYGAAKRSFLMPTNARDNSSADKRQEMIGIVLKCGELAPIPQGAQIKSVKTEGNMFTRSFRLVFEADASVIDSWLDNSKGVKTAKIVETGDVKKYVLNAKCGFQYAEVNVDRQNRTVTVYVSKS